MKILSFILSESNGQVRGFVQPKKVTSDMSERYGDIYCFRGFHFSRRKTWELKGQLMGLLEEVPSLVEQ